MRYFGMICISWLYSECQYHISHSYSKLDIVPSTACDCEYDWNRKFESEWLDSIQQNAIIVTMNFLVALLEAFLLLIPQS